MYYILVAKNYENNIFLPAGITVGFSNVMVTVPEGKIAQVCVELLLGRLGTDINLSVETDIGNYSGKPCISLRFIILMILTSIP